MTDSDDAHTTLGRHFRTPAHPDVLAALGRATFSFLSLEESVTAILYDAGRFELSESRAKTAGEKEAALKWLATQYRNSPGGNPTAEALDAAAAAFGSARRDIRNKLQHGYPFTAGTDAGGRYLPGLGYTERDGRSWHPVAKTPDDLLDLAERVEGAIGYLARARAAVQALPLAALDTQRPEVSDQ